MSKRSIALITMSVVGVAATAQDIVFTDFLLNGDLVVIPADPDPPSGTGSDATGLASFSADTLNETFAFDLVVDGIFTSDLPGRGDNGTSIHLHRGGPLERGPTIIDLHWYALNQPNGQLVDTADGFMLHAEGLITSIQGNLDTGLTVAEILGFIEDELSFVMVNDQEFPTGAIRGNLLVPAPASAVLLGLGVLVATRRRR